jgi:hypothetical protein
MIIRRIVAAACAAAFLAVAAAPMASAEEKALTPQQQKMKDCAAKWKDEKAKADHPTYRKFLSGCLKG